MRLINLTVALIILTITAMIIYQGYELNKRQSAFESQVESMTLQQSRQLKINEAYEKHTIKAIRKINQLYEIEKGI